MQVEIWDPWKEFNEVQRHVQDAFNSFFSRVSRAEAPHHIAFSPLVDVYEAEKDLVIRTSISGAIQDDIDVTIEGNELTIRGVRDAPADSRHGGYYHREWRYGMFERRVALPRPVEADRVHATYTSGVLEIRLPLAPRT